MSANPGRKEGTSPRRVSLPLSHLPKNASVDLDRSWRTGLMTMEASPIHCSIRFRLLQFIDLDIRHQRFEAKLYLAAKWTNPKVSLMKDPMCDPSTVSLQDTYVRLRESDSVDDIVIVPAPQLAFSDLVETKQDNCRVWAEVNRSRKETYIVMHAIILGKFVQAFDLDSFPFDTQKPTIRIRTQAKPSDVTLAIDDACAFGSAFEPMRMDYKALLVPVREVRLERWAHRPSAWLTRSSDRAQEEMEETEAEARESKHSPLERVVSSTDGDGLTLSLPRQTTAAAMYLASEDESKTASLKMRKKDFRLEKGKERPEDNTDNRDVVFVTATLYRKSRYWLVNVRRA